MLEQGLFFDVFPKLNMAMFESQMGSATRRAETAANEMARAISGHDYFASPTTQLDRFAARMETQMRAANNIMDRATERQIAAADRVETAELRKNAAIKRSEEVLAATRDANSARYLQALAVQRKAEQDYAAAVRANSAAQAMFVRAQAGVGEAARRQEEATVASATALGRLGTAATNVGAVIGVGMAGAFAVGASKAGDLEKGLKLLVTGADESEKSIGILRRGILDLQSQWGTAASEQEKALLLIERAGYHGADALKVLTAGVQAAKAEGSNLSTVVHQLTTTMVDFKGTSMGNFTVDLEHVNSVMSMSVEAAALSKSTLEEYARAIGNVEEAARNAGMNMQGLNASFAVMTQHGSTAENASQQIKHAILTLVAPQGPQQATLNQFGISTAQVQQWIADPKIQLGGAVQRIQDAIDSRVGNDGRVHIDPRQVSIDGQRALAAEEAAMTPFQRRIIENFKGSGEISSESFNKVLNGLKEDDRAQLAQWRSLHNNQVGFNRLLRKGFNPDMTVEQAQKAIFGDQPTLQVAQNLVGHENQELYNEKFEKLNADGHTDEHGGVKGSADSQQTLKAQLADLRGALNTDLTQMGESSQGPLTAFVHTLVDLAKFLGEHQGVLQGAGLAGLGLLGGLGVIKGGNAIGRMFGAGDAVVGRAIGSRVNRGVRAAGRGTRNVGSRAGATAWLARQAALDAAMAAPGAARRNVRGLVRGGSSVGGQVHNAALGGMDVLGRARGSRAARWAGRAGIIGLPLALMAASAGMSRADDGSVEGGGGMGDAAMMAMTALPMVGMVGPSLSGVGNAARSGLGTISSAGKGAAETLKGLGKAATELPGKIKAVATGTKAWTAAQWLLDAAMNANPIGIAVVAIAALTAGIIYAYNHSERFRTIVQGALHAVGNAFKSVYDSMIRPFFDNFTRIFSDAWDIAKNIFGFWKDLLTGDFSGAWSHVQTIVSDVVDAAKGYLGILGTAIRDIYDVTLRPVVDSIGNALGKVKNFFKDCVDWVRTEWGKLENIAATPIKWIIEHVYNGGIAPIWNKIDGVFGGHHQLPKISFQAAGGGIWSGPGTLPGYKPGFDEVNAKLSPGESVLTPEASKKLGYGTIVRLNAESGRRSANDAMGQPIRAAGGFLGSLGGWLGSAWDDVKDAAGFATKVLADPVGSVKSLFAKTLGETNDTPGGASQWRQELVDIPKHFVAQAIDTAKGWVGLGKHNAGAAAGTPWTGSGTLDGWIMRAMQIAGVDAGHWGPGLHTLIGRESGGNPNAINKTDINAQRGDPSRGLMQTIGSTFERYRDPSLSDNIYDPISNIVAGIHYIQARYGDIENVQQANPNLPPKGYAGGGINDPHLSNSEKERESGQTTSPFKFPGQAVNDRTAIDRAWSYIHSVAGTAYQYGGLDCSMFLSGIYQSLLGRNPGIRAFNTTSDFLALGFRRGLGGIFQIGVNPKAGQAGHMAGTFDGQHVESGGAHDNVAFGPIAAGAADSQFPDKYYLPGSLFSPPYKGDGAKPTEGQSQANKLHDKARKLREQITKLQGQEKRANDSAVSRDEAAKKAEDDAAKYEAKAASAILESEKKKYLDQAQKAHDRAQKARTTAQTARDKAAFYHQRAQDAGVQAEQADEDATTAWGSPAQAKSRKGSSSDPNHLMTFTEFGEKAGGILAGGLLETFGLSDTVFADPNKSYLLRIGNALINPFAKVPQQEDQEDADNDSGSSTDASYDDSYADSGIDDSDVDVSSSADDMASPDDSLNPDTSLEDTDSSSLPNPGLGDVAPEPPAIPGYSGLGTSAPSAPHGARADGEAWGGPAPTPKSQQLFEMLLGTTPQLHDSGGLLRPGLTLVNNATGVPEAVLAPREKTNLELIARMGIGHPFLGGNTPNSWVHIENLHQNSGEDGHDTGRRIAREMNAFSGSGPR